MTESVCKLTGGSDPTQLVGSQERGNISVGDDNSICVHSRERGKMTSHTMSFLLGWEIFGGTSDINKRLPGGKA